ncbi:MAG TPA: sulfotransferase domain-containing protein [Sphingobium sp.]
MMRGARREIRNVRLAQALDSIDAFLVSYPKSGRTWLRFALSQYFARVADLGITPDLNSTFRILPNFDRDRVRGLPAFIGKRPGLPLIAVSHLSYTPSFFARHPVILLVRDPRDVMVSAYFHATRHKHRFSGDIASFLADRHQGVAAYIQYLNGWADRAADGDMIVLSYEVMSSDPVMEMGRMLRFMGLPVDHDALDRAVAASRFDAMRKLEQQDGIPGHDYDRADEQSLRMRKGKVGGYAEHLKGDDALYILDQCNNRLTPQARDLLTDTGVTL